MQDVHVFLWDLALVLCVAAVTTVVFQRLRQPVVFGYLLAGMIIGPHIPIPLVAGEETVHTLAELGVILLMFGLGLEFSLQKLLRVGPTAGLIAVVQSSAMVSLGYAAGQLFGWSTLESLYAGAAIAISSTTIIVKAFAEQNVRGKFTEIVFGVLIIEDLIAILLLAILTTVSAGPGLSARDLALTAGRIATFLALLVGFGLLVVPRFVRFVVRLNRPETTVVATVGICFASALLALEFGYSVALGAFLAGMLVAESGEEKVVEHLVQPVRDMFGAVFFVAVGMLIDPAVIAQHWGAVVMFTVLVIVGKVLFVTVSTFLAGFGVRTAVQTGMSLAQIGEFSFIIAGVGLSTGATRPFLYPVAIAVSALTTFATPWLIRLSGPAANYVDRRLPGPLQTFVALYGSWLERLRRSPRDSATGSRTRRLVRLLLLDAVLLAVVVIGASIEMSRVTALLTSWTDMSAQAARLTVVAVAALVLAPLVGGALGTSRGIALALAARAVPPTRPGAVDLGAAPRGVLALALQLGIISIIGVLLVTITQPFVPPLRGAVVLVAVLALLSIAFWRGAANLQGHARAGAQVIAAALSHQMAPSERSGTPGGNDAPAGTRANAREGRPSPLAFAREALPGLGEPEAMRLDTTSYAVNRTLTELNLRGLTGATVLAILRAGEEVLIPTGHERLLAGDVLALAGSHEAIEAARHMLDSGELPDDRASVNAEHTAGGAAR